MKITKVKFHYKCIGCPSCFFETDNLTEASKHDGIHWTGGIEVTKEVIGEVEI